MVQRVVRTDSALGLCSLSPFPADSASDSGFDSTWNSDMEGMEEEEHQQQQAEEGKKTRKRKIRTGFTERDDMTAILEGKRRRTSNPLINGKFSD